ncbi:MAG TPA: carboxypeptidase regulatory-like domain-containing protein [Bryobacteraceae bacterium]|nr:carboxypeptidase regulatory-like domain-containing protein [Bryobacteraceae bacterium]
MRREWLLILFLFSLAAATADAQVTTGTILGIVTDSTGAAVSGAQITITNVNRGTTQQYTTDATGSYTAPFLVPGTYRVEVEKAGFKRASSVDTQLEVDQKARVDFSMQLGQVSETITVEAAAPLVRSETAELGEVVNQHSVEALPLNGRNFAQLVYLVPGVTQGQAGENLSGASTFNPRAASDFNSLGSQANANAWLVDGIMDNEYTFNTVMVQPSVESVQEFKVLTGTYSAEFGRGAGVVTTQTRSGTNTFHGSLFEFLRNSYLDARNYFNAVGQKQPPYRRNQFGGSLGGPIWKNKTFFFADYYGWREVKGQTFINTVPTAQDRTGNFSDLPETIYDPYSTATVNGQKVRTAYPNNTIPANELNSVGLNVASIYPLPNLAGFQNNRVDTLSRNLKDNGGNLRIDHKFSDKDSLFGRYSFEQFILFDTKGQGGCCIPTPASAASRFDLGPFIAGGQNTNLAASGFAFNETHIFSPTVVNEFIAGYARTNPLTRQSDYGHDAATSLGIQGININQFTTGIPTMNISGVPGFSSYTSLNGGPSFLPANPRQTSYQLQDDVSFIKGNHNLKVGYRIIKDLVSPFTNTNTRGALTFGLNFTDNPVNASGGNGLADLLLGFLANGTSAGGSRGFLQTPYYLTVWEHAAFLQDDWKVNRRLTLNLGVRWDLFTPYTEERNRLTNFDLSNLTLVYAGVSGISRTAGVQTRWNDFTPHLGFAWDVSGDGKTVLRGGFSSSYFPEQPSGSNFLGQAVPWTISQNTPTTELYPLGSAMSSVPTINHPFGPPVPVQPTNTAQLIAANPSILGGSFTNQTPYYETWSLNVERQLGSSMLAELAYAGSHGVHLLYCYNPQEVEPGPSSIPSNLRVTLPAIAKLRSITQCDPRNMSNYHGLQAKLVKRLSYGLSFLASYTWSKSLDYGGSAASGGGGVGNPQTITDLRAGYGPSGFDIPQRFVGSWTYDLPFGPGRRFLTHGLVGNLIGGWELDGISTIQSGLPFTVYLANCTNNASSCWPDRIGSGSLSDPIYSHWYDPAAFEAPCATPAPNSACPQYAYRFGNSGRGILRAPGTFNFDLAAAKNFSIKERFRVQFRVDAFNALNHPQLGFPNQNVNPTNPAKTSTAITSTIGDNRDLQAAIKVLF